MRAGTRRVLWAVTVLGALALLLRGLLAGIYIEPTAEAVSEARVGQAFVGVACCFLVAASAYAMIVAHWPWWVSGGLLMPVVLCGGLTWLASETLFPQLAVVVAYPAALVAGVAGLVLRTQR